MVLSLHLAHGATDTKGSQLMGYYVTTTAGAFRVPAENIAAAYAAVCALNDRDDLKSGGSWGAQGLTQNSPRPAGLDHHPARWFSWMHADYPNKCATLAEVFAALGFEYVITEDDGTVSISGYDTKTGDQVYFLAAIAPYCEEGSSLDWRGEDGDIWRDEVEGGELWQHDGAQVTFTRSRRVDEVSRGHRV